MLIDQFLKYLQYEKNYSTHTVFAYGTDLKQFFDFTNTEYSEPNKIDSTDVRLWISTLLDSGISAKSINRKLSSLKSYYNYLLKNQLVVDNPVAHIAGPKVSKRLPVFVKENELNVLLDEIDFGSGFEALRDKAIIETFYGTGMRLNELITLNQKDVDLVSDVLKVSGKRNKQRIIPISKTLKRSLALYLIEKNKNGFNSNPLFFVTIKGDAMYHKLIYRIVNKYLNLVTTQTKKSPHVLRHSFATMLLNKGADINAVKSLLGHSNLSATEVYTHNTFEELKKNYNKAHPRA